jgi:glutaredoxin
MASRYGGSRRRRSRGGSIPRVVVYTGAGCHLCERALEVVAEVCGRDGFERVEIDGDEELEAAHRASLPVVEVDGERTFTYFVQPDALRQRLEQGA